MNKKSIAFMLVLAAVLIPISACGGGNNGGDNMDHDYGVDNGGDNSGDNIDCDYGTLAIDDLSVSINSDSNSTFAVIQPVFSDPDKAEELIYTYDDSVIAISEDGIVTAHSRQNKTVNVRASSEHHSVIFKVQVDYIDLSSNARYNVSSYPVSTRARTCSRSLTENSTLFIGDSFMDPAFFSSYATEKLSQYDIVVAGMSSTTSYHWEACYDDIIASAIPKNIVINIGTNNFYDLRDTVEFTEESICRLLMTIHLSYPESNIYLFNICQRTDLTYSLQVDEVNAYMAEWCAQYDWITSVDVSSKITSMYLSDGVHPTSDGYDFIIQSLTDSGCVMQSKG